MTLLRDNRMNPNRAAAFGPVVATYHQTLNANRENHFYHVETWSEPVELCCFCLKPGKLPKGFTNSAKEGAEPIYQYNLRKHGLGRPKAYRVSFLLSPEYDDDKYTVSHLCHHEWCLNPAHHCLELLVDNKGRNGCPGGDMCRHSIRCLIPGPFYRGYSALAPAVGNFVI